MAISDTWFKQDGTPSEHYGRGNRWRIRWHGQSASFPDPKRNKAPTPADRPPRAVEVAWAQMITAKPAGADDVLVGELLDRWLSTKRRLSPSGYTSCRISAARARDAFGGHTAKQVTRPAVREWVAGLEGSASLIRKTVQALSGALQIAVEEQVIGTNPVRGVDLPAERARAARYLEAEQVAALADAMGRYKALVWFMATTGLRIGEVCALNVGDLNRKTSRVKVRAEDVGASKSEPREVTVPASVIGMLELRRPARQPLFTGERGGRLNARWWRKHVFYPAAEAAGLKGVRPHDLRHTAVSLAASSGVREQVVQRMVGHKRPIMTGRYAHLYEADLDAAAVVMDGLVQT